MGRLLFLATGLLFSLLANAQLPKEFRLSPEETDSILAVLNQTYVKLKQLPAELTKSSNVNSIDTKGKLINGRMSFLTIDSCSEENGSSICFVVSVLARKQYPQDIMRFTYDPATKTGLLSMFRIVSPYTDRYVYEASRERVKSKFDDLFLRINEFL